MTDATRGSSAAYGNGGLAAATGHDMRSHHEVVYARLRRRCACGLCVQSDGGAAGVQRWTAERRRTNRERQAVWAFRMIHTLRYQFVANHLPSLSIHALVER